MKIILRKLTPVNEGDELLTDILITDGENEDIRSFPVTRELYSELGFRFYVEKGGNSLSREDFSRLEYAGLQTKALMKGIDLIAYAPNTEKGLVKKLIARGYGKEFAEYAGKKLSSLGYIDEKTQAEFLCEELAKKKLYGPMRIKRELYTKGFCGEAIESALEKEIDYDGVCAERIKKTIGREAFAEKDTRIKATAALSRYGFTFDNIRSALRLLKEEK